MNHSRRPRAVLVLVVGLLAGLSHGAAAQSWSPAGPPGGDVRSLAADPRDPRVVYLGTANGILYRSEDGGLHWRSLRPGFPTRGMSLDDLVVDPQGNVYVGFWAVRGSGGGVARSRDGGTTFEMLEGMAGQSVRALAIAPSDPDTLVAGTLLGIFRSRDAGRIWERISPEGDPELRNLDSIAIDPGGPDTLYVGTWHLPWKTTDGGRSWKSIHTGMIDDSDVMTLTLDRRSPRIVYATACSGIYRSADAAGRWSKIRGIPGTSRRTRAFAQHPSRLDTFYAGTTEGLWTTDDAGATWRLLTSRQLVVNAILARAEGSLLLGTDGAGVLASADGGRSWTASNQGFSERFVSRIAFDRGRVVTAVLGDRQHGGVLAAPGPEGPWSRLGEGLEGREVLSLALAAGEVLAGTDDGVFVSVARSGTWRRLPTVVGGSEAHPRVHDVAAVSDTVLLAATSAGLLRSGDGGERWERKSLGLGGSAEAVAVAGSGMALAATPLGFFKSSDAGVTWAGVSAGAPEARVQNLAFLPGSDRIVFASTSRGLIKSVDQGRTWQHRGGGLPLLDITGLAFHPDGRTILVSEFSRGGLWRSLDAGETWTSFPTTGLLSDRIWALAIDPGAPDLALAAAAAGGVHQWRSTEGGAAAGAQ